MNRQKWGLTGLLIMTLVAALVGPMNTHHVLAQDTTARIRFLHAVYGGPDMDVYLDGAPVAPKLSFGDVTPHLVVAAGSHQVSLRPTGSDPAAPALVDVPVSLAAGLAYTVLAQGTPDQVQAVQYEDVLDQLEPGMARLTAIHAIPDAPALDLLNTDGGPLLQGFSYGVAYGTINIGAGVQDLVIVPAGGDVSSAVMAVGKVSLQSGALYTIVALGQLEGPNPPSALVLVTPLNGSADSVRVQVAHGSPDAPAVDVYADDKLVYPALELGQISAPMALPAGTLKLGLRPAGSPAADVPVVSADVQLAAGTPVVTVVMLGEVSDNSLALQVFPGNATGLTPESARFSIINAVPGATVDVTLSDAAAPSLAAALAASTQSEAVDVAAGDYMLNVSIVGVATPVSLIVPSQVYDGGVIYTVLVYGGGVTQAALNAQIGGAEINVTADSMPGASSIPVVAVVPTVAPTLIPTIPPTVEPVAVEPTQELPPTGETELVPDQPGNSTAGSEVVAAPTVAPTLAPIVTESPKPLGIVELDPGANLHCREYPRADARSLGLIPSGTTLTILARIGAPLPPDTGSATVTPEPTPVIETIEEMWLSVRWDVPDGGYLKCWVSAQYLRIEYKGHLLDQIDELMELPEEPMNVPGEAVNTTVAPPTPPFQGVTATVNVDVGVNLKLRRNPKTSAEVIAFIPSGAVLEALGYVVEPSEGLVGQPVDPNWIKVRYRQENGSAAIGWISAQYVILTQFGRPYLITDLPLADANEMGYLETPGQQPVIPLEQQAVVGVINLDPGANLNLRDRPDANAFVVRAIPSGNVLTLIGRNGDGSWVQATYASDTGDLQGWVATQYLTITRGGKAFDVSQLPVVTGETDAMVPGQPAPAVQPTATPG